MSNTVRIIVCRVGRLPVVEMLSPDEDRPDTHLAGMQRIVGGFIDRVGLDDGLDCWFNDEGLILGLPLNRRFPVAPRQTSALRALIPEDQVIYIGDPASFAKPSEAGEYRIHGDLFLARSTEDGELADVTDEDVARYTALFDSEDIEAARQMNEQRVRLMGGVAR